MEGGGTRMGSRSSSRHGPAAVFNGPVRRWRKSWSPVSASSMSLSSSRLQLYKWMPQGPREDNSEDSNARAVKYLPLFVVMERRKEAAERRAAAAAAEDAAGTGKEEQEGVKKAVGPQQAVEPQQDSVSLTTKKGKENESEHKDVGNKYKVDAKEAAMQDQVGGGEMTQDADLDMLSEESDGTENE